MPRFRNGDDSPDSTGTSTDRGLKSTQSLSELQHRVDKKRADHDIALRQSNIRLLDICLTSKVKGKVAIEAKLHFSHSTGNRPYPGRDQRHGQVAQNAQHTDQVKKLAKDTAIVVMLLQNPRLYLGISLVLLCQAT